MDNLIYDTCAQKQQVSQSVSPLSYMLDPVKHQHSSKCRPQLGIVGGTAVSHVSSNLVDVENNLRGMQYPATKCPGFKFSPANRLRGQEYIKPVRHPRVAGDGMQHLPPCQFQTYPEVYAAPPLDVYEGCGGGGARGSRRA